VPSAPPAHAHRWREGGQRHATAWTSPLREVARQRADVAPDADGGTGWWQLITRLEPLIHELHSFEEPLLIVSHQATLRVLRAYLLRNRSMPRDDCPSVDIPQHTVMKITWDGWNYEVKPSALEATMKTAAWPPPEDRKWKPEDAEVLRGAAETPLGSEEWFWLGPDPKRSDGQHNL